MKVVENNYKKHIKIILQVLLYSSVIYFIGVRVASTDDVWHNIGNIDIFFFVLGIFVFAIQTLFNGYMWYYIMKASGEEVTLKSQMSVYLNSYLLRYIPGNVVGILARGEFNRKHGVSRLKSLWGWFLENVTFLSIGLSIGIYFIVKNFPDLTGLNVVISDRSDLVVIGSVLLFGLIIFSSALLMFKGNALWELFNNYVIRKLLKKNLGKHIDIKLTNQSRVLITLGYLFSWVLYSTSFILIAYSIVPMSINYPLATISINALAWSLGYLFIITPSGTGVREAVFLTLLPMIAVISPANSAIIAVGMRLVTILGELSAFIIYKGYNMLIKLNGKLD